MNLDLEATTRMLEMRKLGSQIGNTELFEIPTSRNCARVFAKLEFQNPFGSVKDRVAFSMVHKLLVERAGRVGTVLEYTGGSLGLALSSICSRIGLPLKLVVGRVPEALLSHELAGHCTVERVHPELGFWYVMERAEELAASNSNYEFLNQHENEANVGVHRSTTGVEIIRQLTERNVHTCDAWIASIGTGGSLVGVYQALNRKFRNVKLFGVSPRELPYGSLQMPNGLPKISGSGGLGCGRRQPFVVPFEKRLKDKFEIGFEEAVRECERFKSEFGFTIGTSAAANLISALEVAKRMGSGKSVLTLFPSAK